MIKIKRVCLFIKTGVCAFILTAYSFTAFAQSASNSPYSRYGLGEINSAGTAQNLLMGGTGVALQNYAYGPFFINPLNPASYAKSQLIIIEAGVISNTTKHANSTSSAITNNTSINYLSFLVPVNKWWGSSVGFKPYSNIGYNIEEETGFTGVGSSNYKYTGDGSINQLYWGNGFKIKNLYAGVNANYLFGNMTNSRYVLFHDTSNAYNFKSIRTTRVNDITLNYGLQYAFSIDTIKGKPLQEKISIVLGATASTQTNINVSNDLVSYSYVEDNPFAYLNGENIKDTIENRTGIKGTIVMPLNLAYGISFRKGDRWLVSTDFSTQSWSQYSFLGVNANLKNTMNVSAGAVYTPNSKAESSYFQKVAYRAGIRYTQTPVEIKNVRINETAFSFGLGLPVGRSRQSNQYSVLNIGFELGQRGTTEQGLIQENFAKVFVGFTMNDKWFIRPKFD